MTRIKIKKLSAFALVILFGVGLGLLLLEILLRLTPAMLPLEVHGQLGQKLGLVPVGQPRFLVEYRQLWEADPSLRERMKPGLNTIIHGNPEYPVWPIKTSSLGLGSRGYRDTRPEQPPFALVLGDSFGFGVGVAQESVWSEILEQKTGLPFVNLSQVGASSLQEARIYEEDGRHLTADVVFWLFFQNDLKDNLRFTQWLTPEIAVELAQKAVNHPCQGRGHRLLKRLSLAYELLLFWQRTCEYSAMTPTPRYIDDRLSLVFCLDHDICDLGVQARMLTGGWPLTRQALQNTRAIVEAQGAELVVIVVPSKEQVYWEQYQPIADLSETYDIDQIVAPVRHFCRQEQLYCLDLTEVFRADVGQGPQRYFPVDIHWNESGHALVAEAVWEYLQQEQLVQIGDE